MYVYEELFHFDENCVEKAICNGIGVAFDRTNRIRSFVKAPNEYASRSSEAYLLSVS